MPGTRAHDVILEILRWSDGEWTGKSKLHKAFYFAHLYYANERPGLLTDWPIARMPQGPGIANSDRLFGELIAEGYLALEQVHEGPYPECRYRLTDKARNAPRPIPNAQAAIKDAAQFCLPKSAAELSQITHERSRSWIEGHDGEILNIYLDTIPDEEYQKRKEEIAVLDEQLAKALGGAKALREEIAIGAKQADEGRVTPFNEATLNRAKERVHNKTAAES